jgi:SAM-dependent methyltransferase
MCPCILAEFSLAECGTTVARQRPVPAVIHLAAAANALLRPLSLKVVRRTPAAADLKPWDRKFATWIRQAEQQGLDPNDLGDRLWADDRLDQALARHYLPVVTPDAVVLELGPGTGRLTRHVIGRCREMILADYSRLVCEWLPGYLQSKGACRVVQLEGPSLTEIAGATVDVVLAHGVFEHVDLDDMARFLGEFHRVLRREGTAVFNFDNPMSPGGLEWFERWRPSQGGPGIFRFHHPEVVVALASRAGFHVEALTTDESRLATIKLRKRVD